MKSNYFMTKLEENKQNSKETWSLLKLTLGIQNDKSSFPKHSMSITNTGHDDVSSKLIKESTITPTFKKKIEQIMNNKLVSFFESHQILFQHQYGFRKKTQHCSTFIS